MFLMIFDFLAEWFVGLSTDILEIIDLIMEAVNKISGVEDIMVDGKETDFLTYLIRTDRVAFAFGVAALCGIILLFLFSAIQVIIVITKDKVEETPVMVLKKTLKNFLILLFVPTFMIAFMMLTNAFIRAMYDATMQGSSSLGQFMFEIFAQDAWQNGVNPFTGNNPLKYTTSCSDMWDQLDLWDYHFLYSWLIGGLVIYALLGTALMLVERCISIALLYIMAPFAVASSVLDDGAKFKSWRDQLFIKFFTGHGAILAINVYMLVVSVLMDPTVRFFDNGVLNAFTKLVFITGGAFSLKSVQAVIGNLIQVGAGDKAVAEASQAASKTGSLVGGIFKSPVKAPLTAAKKIHAFGRDAKEYGARNENGKLRLGSAIGSTIANRLGFKTARDYGKWSKSATADRNSMNDKNKKSPVEDAIKGPNNDSGSNNNNQKLEQPRTQGQSMVQNAIAGSNNNK